MTGTELMAGVLAFLGAGLGSYLSFRAAQRSTRQQEAQGRREEWGRRFSAALDMLADSEDRRQVFGASLLTELAASELASPEERALADALLDQAARVGDEIDLPAGHPGITLDRSVVVEDDGGQDRR